TGAEAPPRAPGLRPQHPALRRRRPPAARRPGGGAHAQHRRRLRSRDERQGRRRLRSRPMSGLRPFFWSLRRELWEHRSLYVAPLSVAGVVLFGFGIRALFLPRRMRTFDSLELAKQQHMIVTPYSMAAALIIVTAYLAAAYYCLDALYG